MKGQWSRHLGNSNCQVAIKHIRDILTNIQLLSNRNIPAYFQRQICSGLWTTTWETLRYCTFNLRPTYCFAIAYLSKYVILVNDYNIWCLRWTITKKKWHLSFCGLLLCKQCLLSDKYPFDCKYAENCKFQPKLN